MLGDAGDKCCKSGIRDAKAARTRKVAGSPKPTARDGDGKDKGKSSMAIKLSSIRRSRIFLAALGAVFAIPVAALGLGPSASAISPVPPPTAQTFAQCPVNGSVGGKDGHVTYCIVGVAAQGTIDIGPLDTTFHGPGVVQGGFSTSSPTWLVSTNWADALDGKSYSAPRQLLSIPVMTLLGNPDVTPPANSDVYVVSQQAGPMGFDIATPGIGGITPYTVIPLSFHLVNPLLGPDCYIGTDSDPITLHLTTATSGALTGALGTLQTSPLGRGEVIETIGTEVVDNTFTAPPATGCGTDGVWDSAITAMEGADAPGSNSVILYGNFDLVPSKLIKHLLHE